MVRAVTYRLILTNKNLYKAFFSMMLSHHPECDVYSDHSFKIGKIRLCKSCSLAIFSAAIFTPVFLFTPLLELFKSFTTSLIIIMVLSPFMVVYISGKGNNKIRTVSRILFGLFALSLLVSTIAVPEFQFKLLYIVIMATGIMIIAKRRMDKMTGICRECGYNSEFSSCPGFTSLQMLVNETANKLEEMEKQAERNEQ
ncbi:MAG: hypothetical protein ACTSP4_12025 [Candidatus Hodarchaeales archaeon]